MRGFSLIELLVAMTIVALLAGLAMPGYSHVVMRAQRQDARLALLRIHYQQERYFALHQHYALGLESGPDGLAMPSDSEQGHYQLQMQVTADRTHYTAVATADPDGRQAMDSDCARLSMSETGKRASASRNGSWRQKDNYRCWG